MAGKGVIVEFDFAAMDGAELLFRTTRDFLKELDGIELDKPTEARHLVGASYLDGLNSLFAAVKTKKTAQRAARELELSFNAALTAAVPAAVGVTFRNFVRTLTDKGVSVVIVTRADVKAVQSAFPALEGLSFFQDTLPCYGSLRGMGWRKACAAGSLNPRATVAVAGSGQSVKSALVSGFGVLAVVHDHVDYQDFGGADDVVTELSAKTAKQILGMLRV